MCFSASIMDFGDIGGDQSQDDSKGIFLMPQLFSAFAGNTDKTHARPVIIV